MKLQKSLRSIIIIFALLAGTVSANAQSRYTYSATGDEVTDTQTGLVWRRCSEGQSWSGGTCTGTASTYTHEAALMHAQAQTGATGWRLPNIKELSSILDKTRLKPGIDLVVFPGTPFNGFWTVTPYTGVSSNVWVVVFGPNNGSVGNDLRGTTTYHVRLVR